MLSMIDVSVTRDQFTAFPMAIALRLLTAAEADIIEWSDRLVAAWVDIDREEIRRARHSLKGLCGNFGAVKLLEMSEQDLSKPEAKAALLELRTATLHAIRVVALGHPSQAE